MFTVTFYSFKGGVGRTMALVNVGALLAEAGNRVLLVDFDLEAPGLPSYGALKGAKGRAGILDYVESYQRELVAPDVNDYIVECPIFGDGKSLWLMPAGRSLKPSYSDQLNRMDWERLYTDQSGYLMFEDLKEQWRQFGDKGFDYVLIDSRTGYTDVGGICTRQLPDSVVIMFMPTAQNIDGLAPIVSGIKAEQEQGRDIRIHFCAANVPDEYDEDELVAKLLQNARSKLGYGGPSEKFAEAVVHHRISLALLNDPLIVQTRPKSKLAKEYRQLRDRITADNLSDPGGAEIALKKVLKETGPGLGSRLGEDISKYEDALTEITRHHSGNANLSLLAAEAYRQIGNYEQVVASATRAIELGYNLTRALFLRGVAQMALDDQKAALKDFESVLTTPGGTTFDYRPAADLLRHAAHDPKQVAREIFSNPLTSIRAKLELSHYLLQKGGDFDFVADNLLADLDTESRATQRFDRINAVSLALIAAHRFEDAIALIENEEIASHLSAKFNLAVALWGRDGKPPLNLFQEIASVSGQSPSKDANVHQCFALAWAVTGESELALAELHRAESYASTSSQIFSCWTYNYGPADRFIQDVAKMRERIEAGKSVRPAVTMPQ